MWRQDCACFISNLRLRFVSVKQWVFENSTVRYSKRVSEALDRSDIGLSRSVQDCSNSIANALELLQSCTKPTI